MHGQAYQSSGKPPLLAVRMHLEPDHAAKAVSLLVETLRAGGGSYTPGRLISSNLVDDNHRIDKLLLCILGLAVYLAQRVKGKAFA